MRGGPETLIFRKDMLDRLNDPKNAAKGDWRNLSRKRVCLMVLEEAAELIWAIFVEWWRWSFGTRKSLLLARIEVEKEAADLAVVAMFASEKGGRP